MRERGKGLEKRRCRDFVTEGLIEKNNYKNLKPEKWKY
jgi:hypothetical protein